MATMTTELKKDIFLMVVVGVVIVGLVLLALIFLPSTVAWFVELFEPGLGLKTSSIIGFFVASALLIVFALVSGDGMIGEIQFMILGFLVFFFIFTLMIAWVF